MPVDARVPAAAVMALCAAACEVSPLTNKLAPGEEPFVIVVGEGRDRQTDLFAASTSGGQFFRVTFSRPAEAFPAISPNGLQVAFVRSRSAADTAPWDLVVMDLAATGEWRTPLPADAEAPEAVGWSAAGDRVFVRAGALYAAEPPPARSPLASVAEVEAPGADSATHALLGDPPFAAIAPCGEGVCAVTATHDTTRFAAGVTQAFRWGGDSVGLVHPGGRIEVRPLGGGRTRVPAWSDAPAGLRWPAHHPGGAPAGGADSPAAARPPVGNAGGRR